MSNRRWRTRCAALAVLPTALFIALPGAALGDTTPSQQPQVNPEEKAAALIRPAVVYLDASAKGWIRAPNGSVFGPYLTGWRCTGFVVNPAGWVGTAGHCAGGSREAIIQEAVNEEAKKDPTVNPDQLYKTVLANDRVEGETGGSDPEMTITVTYGTGKGTTLPAEVSDVRAPGKGDVALLKVQKSNLPSSELGTDADVSIGTPILAVGYPGSTDRVTDVTLDPTNKSGKISKKSTQDTMPVYEIDAALSPGMSGGPTIALDGKVLGVNSFGPKGEQQAFNFIAPSSGLAELMSGKNVTSELGPADHAYRSGLDNFYAGNYSDAIADFDEAMSLSPDYPGAADYKTNAVNNREKYGDTSTSSSSNVKWYALAGLAAVLVAGAAVMVVRSRRAATATAGGPGPGPQPTPGVPPTPGPPPAPDAPPPTGPAAATTAPFTDGTSAQAPAEGGAQPSAEAGPESPEAGAAASTTAPTPPNEAGATPEAARQEPHFCASCGAEHHPNEKFCPNCGTAIT
ncbi:trypsin-like peptidase domain-containing protein [Rhodococcus sp. NPDC127528]|uniref:trypsin-like peptidase domain-containing protein n=1 Tax=unclassified Rhodococcus (in: high G+C Gram-positive bacteria) TaxID=192944 RepID=UPI0036399157